MTNDKPLSLLWHIDGPIDREVDNAKKRFGQRPELAGRQPEQLLFRPGETPAQLPLNGLRLRVSESNRVPVGGYFVLA